MALSAWERQKLRELQKTEPEASPSAVKRAERHASGEFTVVKADK